MYNAVYSTGQSHSTVLQSRSVQSHGLKDYVKYTSRSVQSHGLQQDYVQYTSSVYCHSLQDGPLEMYKQYSHSSQSCTADYSTAY